MPFPPALHPVPDGLWTGRTDGDEPAARRFHQVTRGVRSLAATDGPTVAFIGYACDAGVRRNLGRPGAADGPAALRKALAPLPSVADGLALVDLGDVRGPDPAATQETLAAAVEAALAAGAFPVVLGGGHDLAFGTWLGVRRAAGRDAGVTGAINLDAHLDLRPVPAEGPNSGTSYTQVADACRERRERFAYAIAGVQPTGNTRALLERARSLGVESHGPARCVPGALDAFLAGTDRVALSIDLDAFAADLAPGVSAPSPLGLRADPTTVAFLRGLAADPRVAAIDLAELNPGLDRDDRTARLGAALLWHALDARFGGRG